MKQMSTTGFALIILKNTQMQIQSLKREFERLKEQEEMDHEEFDEIRFQIKTLEMIEHDLKEVL